MKSRRLSAIMFTDIVDYSRLMGRDESAAMTLLENKEGIISPIITEFNGKIKKSGGDGYLIEFGSAVDAVRCAKKVQNTISEFNITQNVDEKIVIRIGIHLGDILIRDNDIFGNDVNIASRIESLAEPGGICISQTVYDQIKNKVEIQTVNLGEKELKNIADKVGIYKVLIEAQTTASESKNEENENDDPEASIDNEETSKEEDAEQSFDIPEKVVINDGDEKVDINIDKEGKEVTINVENKDKKTSGSTKKEQVKIGLGGIHIKDGEDEVTIGPGGIKVKEKDGDNVEIGLGGIKVTDGKRKNINKKEISNFSKAIIKLISGVAFLVLITGIFTELYDFWYGVIGASAVAILANTLKTLLQSNFVKAIITLLSGVAFLVLITGIFTELYDFWYGVIGTIGVVIISASLKSLFGIRNVDVKGNLNFGKTNNSSSDKK